MEPINSNTQPSKPPSTENAETPEIVKVSLRIITNKAEYNDVENLAERISVSRDTVTTALKVFISKFGNDPKGISPQSQQAAFIFEVAKIAAAKNGLETSQNIQKYGIEDQKHLFEIAKISAAQNGWETSACIKNYGIEDQRHLFEIAKIAAAQSGWGTSYYIKNYGIEDQEQLFEIAKISAAQNGWGASKFIQNYGIKDQNQLVEIAKIAVLQDVQRTSEFIKNYGIEDQKHLIEIAKIAAEQDGEKTSYRIQEYGIEDQDQLFEIAKIAAAQDGWGTSYYIKNYGIKDQEQLFEIAKISAAQSGEKTSACIKNYGIKDPKQLFEIAKIAAAQSGGGTLTNIKNYGIEDQKQLIEIAKIAAAQSGGETSVLIQSCGIKDQKQLIEIAKIAAAQSGGLTSEYIQRYGIKDQEQHFAIAKIAAEQSGWGTSQYIKNYGIEDQEQLIEIAKIAAAQDGLGTSVYIQEYGIKDQEQIIEVMLFCLLGNVRSVKYLSNFGLGIDDFCAGVSTEDQVKRALELIKEEPVASQHIYKKELLKVLFEMRNPEARRAAAQLLIQLEKEKRFEVKEPLDIVRQLTGLELEVSPKTFKKSNLLPQILITTRDLLEVGEAKRLLPLALEDVARKRKRNLQAASALIAMGDIDRLKGIKTKEDLAVALKEAFSEKFNLGEIENFDERYAKTFGSYREGNSLMVYYGDVCKLPPADKEAVMKDLCTFVDETLRGTFSTNRYEYSLHLEGLDIDFWKEDIFKTIELSTSGSSFDFTKLLKTKFADRHLPEEVYRPLEPYLGDPKLEVKQDFTPLQKALVMLMRKGTSELTKVQKALKDEYPDAEFNSDVQGWIDESNKSTSGIKKYPLHPEYL